MHCTAARELLGTYVDGELAEDLRPALDAHLRGCAACTRELASLRELVSVLSDPAPAQAPEGLWGAIQSRLGPRPAQPGPAPRVRFGHWPAAMAAGVLLAVGLGLIGLLWSNGPSSRAEASSIDFGILLDGLPLDPQRAFQDFLDRYSARPIAAQDARRNASTLVFAIPAELPGGFYLQAVYALRFGEAPGVAARYARNGEFLATVFHRPVQREHYGTHQDLPCVVGPHRGHMVAVGEWKMVHLADPTTCHCVLSKLDEQTELPAIMAVISPGSAGAAGE